MVTKFYYYAFCPPKYVLGRVKFDAELTQILISVAFCDMRLYGALIYIKQGVI